jgi:hypothetical protein
MNQANKPLSPSVGRYSKDRVHHSRWPRWAQQIARHQETHHRGSLSALPCQTRTLWIDAVCLNQSDYEELNRQVPRIHDIYRIAWMSTLWLGTEDESSTHALKTFRYLGNQIVAEADTGLLFNAPGAEEKKWHDPDFELPYSQETWRSIRKLLQRL